MSSVIDICNMALAHCRAGNINSLTEGSVQAYQCNLFYDICRNQVLEDAPWGFATRLEPLALLDDDVFNVFNWAYAYQYPSDCLKVGRLVLNYEQVDTSSSFISNRVYGDTAYPQPNLNQPVQYEIFDIDGTTVIAANESDLRIKYNAKITNPNKFSSAFTLALSHLLAANIAVPIAGEEKGRSLRKESLTLYRSFLNNAIANDLNQRHEPVPDSEFITVRS